MRYDEFSIVRVDVEGGVAVLTIDAGELNLMDVALLAELDAVGRRVEADEAVRVVVIQSANP
jgi:enoyl-CoA hydratase/carnithine racemase